MVRRSSDEDDLVQSEEPLSAQEESTHDNLIAGYDEPNRSASKCTDLGQLLTEEITLIG